MLTEKICVGQRCWIVESNSWTCEVEILRISGNIYTIKLIQTGGAIAVPRHRLFLSEEEAKNLIVKPEKNNIVSSPITSTGYRKPYKH